MAPIAIENALKNKPLAAASFVMPEQGKAILADLGEMTLSLYQNGIVEKEYPILSKGTWRNSNPSTKRF